LLPINHLALLLLSHMGRTQRFFPPSSPRRPPLATRGKPNPPAAGPPFALPPAAAAAGPCHGGGGPCLQRGAGAFGRDGAAELGIWRRPQVGGGGAWRGGCSGGARRGRSWWSARRRGRRGVGQCCAAWRCGGCCSGLPGPMGFAGHALGSGGRLPRARWGSSPALRWFQVPERRSGGSGRR
jgi:hypothetical protein